MEGVRHRLVDQREISGANQLLEDDDTEHRFNAGGVAIHHEADRARRSQDRDLRIAEAVLLAEAFCLLPAAHRRLPQRQRHRVGSQNPLLRGLAVLVDPAHDTVSVAISGLLFDSLAGRPREWIGCNAS